MVNSILPQPGLESIPCPTFECQHHWLIEPPDNSTSQGTCRYCGETKTFYNSTEELEKIDEDFCLKKYRAVVNLESTGIYPVTWRGK